MSTLERERAAFATGAYARRLQLELLAVGRDEASTSLPLHEAAINRSGRVHGGAIASVMFAAARFAAASSEGGDVARDVTCVHAHIAFLAVPSNDAVVSHARVLRRGRDVAHVAAKALGADGGEIARAALTVAFADATRGRTETVQPRAEVDVDPSMAASPYLSRAGVTRIAPEGRVARLRIPYALNDAPSPPRVDDGAIAGLVDSCAAFASYLDGEAELDRSGVTVSMSLSIFRSAPADLIGRAQVIGRSGESRVAQVDVAAAESGHAVASGLAVYRLLSGR